LQDEQFIALIQAQFELHDIPPQLICFEVNETLAIANLTQVTQLSQALQKLGCHFALDPRDMGLLHQSPYCRGLTLT
jgi:EAL domain-containing protein (putative c-di-GMP-specific phosphodiesterase class I)